MVTLNADNRKVITVSRPYKGNIDLKKLFKTMYDYAKRERTGADGKTKYYDCEHCFEYIGFGRNSDSFSNKLCGVFIDKMDKVDVVQIRIPFNKRYLSFPIFTGLRDKMYYCTTGFCVCKDKWTLRDFMSFKKECDFIDIYMSETYHVEHFHKKLFENGLIDYQPNTYYKW